MAGNKIYKVDTAVIAAAGYGTRLLPLTLHQPKAMVPVAGRPLIHYVIDQIAVTGVQKFIIVTNPAFKQIGRYIADQKRQGNWKNLQFKVIEKKSKSFADSILAAEKFIGGKYFIAAACDDLLSDRPAPFKSFIRVFQRYRAPMMILREITKKEIPNYGCVAASGIAKDVWQIHDIVEKPAVNEAPSSFGAIADYVLPPDIFRWIRLAQKNMPKDKEINITHVLKLYARNGRPLFGWVFRGRHFDGGSKIGLAKASAYFKTRSKLI